MRESIDVKGRRYLCEGRVLVEHVDTTTVLASVRGSDTVYHVTGDDHGWTCDCPAQRRCCHEVAVQLVTVRPKQHANA